MLFRPDGSFIATNISALRLTRPYHIGNDGAIAVIDSGRFIVSRSLFASVPEQIIPLNVDANAILQVSSIRRDSVGYSIIYPVFSVDIAGRGKTWMIHKLRVENGAAAVDSIIDTLVMQTIAGQVYGSEHFTIIDTALHHACDGIDSIGIGLQVDIYYGHGSSLHIVERADLEYSVDQDGNFDHAKQLRSSDAFGAGFGRGCDDIISNKLAVRREGLVPSSAIIADIPVGDSTLRVSIPVVMAMRGAGWNHRRPSIFVGNDSLAIVWESASPQRTFFLGALDFNRDTAVAPQSFVPAAPNSSTHVTVVTADAPGGRPVIATSLYQAHAVTLSDWVYSHTYSLYGALPDRWSPIKEFYNSSSTYDFSNDHYSYDPNTRALLGIVSEGSAGTNIFRIDAIGKPIADYQVRRFGAVAVASLDEHRWLLVDSAGMDSYNGDVPERSIPLSSAADSRFMRLLGPYLLRYYPTMGYDSAGHLRDSSVTFELYHVDSLQAGAIRSAVVRPASGMADLAVVQRPSDRSLHLLSGGSDGLHHLVLDSVLRSNGSDSVVSATHGRVAAPSGVFRGDSLYVAWEDYRDGLSVIYGRVLGGLPLTGAVRTPGDSNNIGEGDELRMRVFPIPTRDYILVEFSLRSAGDLEIEIYDSMGRLILHNVLESLPIGPGRYDWRCRGIHPGVYFIRLSGPDGAQVTRKVIVLD